jgi:hypothetical protein
MRILVPAMAGVFLLAGCAGLDAPNLPPPTPVAVFAPVSDPASPTGTCLTLTERHVTGRTVLGFARTEFRPTGRLFCPAPGVVAWGRPPPPS